jgi:tetratricopeptide (TPR) repeat protein
MKNRVRTLALVFAVALTLSLSLPLASCSETEAPLTAEELLDLGEKYLSDIDYEQAVAYFERLIEFDAQSARAYTGLAEAYIGLGHTDKARDILEKGLEKTGGSRAIQRASERLEAEIGYNILNTAPSTEEGTKTPHPAPSAEPTIDAITTPEPEHTYEIFIEDVSWEEAYIRCSDKGGYLATVTTQFEHDEIVRLAESAGAKYIWLGGRTFANAAGDIDAAWITGEGFGFSRWSVDEPSGFDPDGTPESYIMLWNVESLGGWTWNDQRNNPMEDYGYFAGKIAYICEYEG